MARAVLPILHLNGYKIANPTVFARIEPEELDQFLRGCGWTPYYVEGDEPSLMHAAMAATLPGVQLVPGQDGGANGFSVLGLGADQNNTTLNGMMFGGAGLPRAAQSWPSARSASVRLAAAKTVTGSWARAGLAAMASPPRAASNGRRCIRLRAVALSPDNDIDR
jgi:hypothetical protein